MSALPIGLPGYPPGQAFLMAPFVAAINKNRKQDASYQGHKVDRTVSDVISTLRTRTI
ncbi:MAG: hypothetical protein KAT50_03395 [Pirellulales bacterium]|nr:hypothetical protein [Pirellulales bacterium]